LGAAVSTIRRTAEAAALRMILTEEMKGNENPVVVLGDLNDSQLSNTLNILTGQPNYLLSGLDKGGSDTALYTTGTLQEYRSLRDVYYTHIYKKIKETLDHILVSQEFYDNSRKRLWAFKGMELFNDHLNADNHKEDGSSDHGIVRATFEYRPAK
jgi:predicted extracellular nuclease